jgi:hypothetical protein
MNRIFSDIYDKRISPSPTLSPLQLPVGEGYAACLTEGGHRCTQIRETNHRSNVCYAKT